MLTSEDTAGTRAAAAAAAAESVESAAVIESSHWDESRRNTVDETSTLSKCNRMRVCAAVAGQAAAAAVVAVAVGADERIK